jgi:hypothetical protein
MYTDVGYEYESISQKSSRYRHPTKTRIRITKLKDNVEVFEAKGLKQPLISSDLLLS